jgi:hypothetical protein
MKSDYRLLDDYGSIEEARGLQILKRDDGDIIFGTTESSQYSIQIAMSGTRYSHEFRMACQEFFNAIQKEIETTKNRELRKFNWMDDEERFNNESKTY